MGAYAYCHLCDAAMNKPTVREIVTDDWRCHAGHYRELINDKDDLLIELDERLSAIEEKLGIQR